MAQGRRDFLFGIDQARERLPAARRAEGALRRPARPRAVVVPGRRHAAPPVARARLVRLLPARRDGHARRRSPRSRSPRRATGHGRRRRRAARDAPAGLADLRLVPGRHDLRTEREGRPHVGAAAQAARDLRRADRADDDRRERRLVEARRRAHGADAGREGDRRRRGRRADDERRAQGHDPARRARRRSSRRARG